MKTLFFSLATFITMMLMYSTPAVAAEEKVAGGEILTPKAFADLYRANALDADRRYAGTIMTLKGVVSGSILELPIRRKGEDAYNLSIIEQGAKKNALGKAISPKISCSFTEDQEAALRKLKPGQTIVITGKVSPRVGGGSPSLEHCKIIRVE